MKFLSLILWLEWLCTDADDDDADNTDNYARGTNHHYIEVLNIFCGLGKIFYMC